MPPPEPDPNPGRSLGWRLAMAAGGLLAAGTGLAVILVPRILAWAVGGTLAIVGLLLLVSALSARGRGQG